MKSPLVEALRQAKGGGPSAERPSPSGEVASNDESSLAARREDTPDADELQLMLSTGVHGIEAPADDGPSLLATSTDIVLSEEFPGHAEEPQHQEMTTESDSQAVPPALLTAAGVVHEDRRPGVPQLGRYSPLICLLLSFAATGSYLLYQHLGGNFHNSDLASLSTQLGATESQRSHNLSAVDKPLNQFKLIVGPQASLLDRPTPQRTTAPVESSANTQTRQSTDAVTAVTVVAQASFNDNAFDTLNAAYLAYENGDFAAAEAGYRHALLIAPRHPNALQGLAAILHRTGQLQESLELYEMLLSLAPNNTAAAAALIAGRHESPTAASESDLKQLIQRHPNSARLHFVLGTLLARKSRWPSARLAFDQALRLDPANADYLFNLAVCLEHLGQYSEARRFYQAALEKSTASSSLNSDIVVARIAELAQIATTKGAIQ